MDFAPLTLDFDEQTRSLSVAGSVDEVAGPALRLALEKYSVGYSQDLVVDLGEVDFLPSLGVGVLAVALRNADQNGTTIELVAVDGTVAQRVLTICGLPHRVR